MRSSDVVAVALIMLACLVVVQATWEPTTIKPGEADAHMGKRVQVAGVLAQITWFEHGGRGAIVADGAMLHVLFMERHDIPLGAAIQLTGSIEREHGLPILRVEAHHLTQPEATTTSLAAIAVDPIEARNNIVAVHGNVDGAHLEAEGHRVPLRGERLADGPATITGALLYRPDCLCHVIVVTQWTR